MQYQDIARSNSNLYEAFGNLNDRKKGHGRHRKRVRVLSSESEGETCARIRPSTPLARRKSRPPQKHNQAKKKTADEVQEMQELAKEENLKTMQQRLKKPVLPGDGFI